MTQEIVKEKINRINAVLSKSKPFQHGFSGGSLGLLFYYHHAGLLLRDKSLLKKGGLLLEKVFEDINMTKGGLVGTALSNGGAGLAYVANYLQQNGLIEIDIEEEFKNLDEFLFTDALTQIENDHIDYLHGALGTIFYFSGRQQNTVVKNYLNTLVDKLIARAVQSDFGIWFKNTSGSDNDEEINFSLAHGLSGILLILIRVYPLVNNKLQCERIIREGIRFIMKHELPVDFENDEFSFFPGSFNKNKSEIFRFNRLAWCYGDLSEILLLYRAGKLFNDNRYTSIANRIGLRTVGRTTENNTLCNSSHFCHGSSGLAQMYKTLYFETGNYQYKKAYEFWIDATLKFIDTEIEKEAYSINNVSLLEGWAGVALVLTDFLSVEKGNWPKVFLL